MALNQASTTRRFGWRRWWGGLATWCWLLCSVKKSLVALIHIFEDLKEKLVGFVVVVLAVFFLDNVIESKQALDVLMLGGGIAAVIFALTYFIGRIQKK